MSARPHGSDDLPLLARNALVELLLHDLGAPGGRTVREACALLADTRQARGDSAAVAHVALVRSGLLRDAGAGEGDPAAASAPGWVAPPWSGVALARLGAYRDVLERAPRGSDLDTRLVQAQKLFGVCLFFEVHEVLEPPWRAAAGGDRTILQGIIQTAVAWHHAARGNDGGARRSGEAALAKLADAPDAWHGFPLEALRSALAAFHAGSARAAAPAPADLVRIAGILGDARDV